MSAEAAAGSAARTGLRKLSTSGWITVMPPALNVSASLPSCARISASWICPLASRDAFSTWRCFASSAAHAFSLMTMRRGVMTWPVRIRYFCTSLNLLVSITE